MCVFIFFNFFKFLCVLFPQFVVCVCVFSVFYVLDV